MTDRGQTQTHTKLVIYLSLPVFVVVGCGGNDKANNSPDEPTTPSRDATQSIAPPTNVLRLPPAPAIPPPPSPLPATPGLHNDEQTANRVALGRLLFFDRRLSRSGTRACATCHNPDHGWSHPDQHTVTDAGKRNARHPPSLLNTAYYQAWGWDGAARSLEDHVRTHWPGQLGRRDDAATTLTKIPAYAAHWKRSFTTPPTNDNIAVALASFIRTLRSGDAPWDRYAIDGDRSAVDQDVIDGKRIYDEVAQCSFCHPPPLYTDSAYYRLTTPQAGEAALTDLGRQRATGRAGDAGKFRTPGLRGITVRPRFFHDGITASLPDAVGRVLRGLPETGIAEFSQLPALNAEQTRKLLAFIRALTPRTSKYARPTLPRGPQ